MIANTAARDSNLSRRRWWVAGFAALALVSSPAAAQRQSIETTIDVPGIGQEIANGIYFFKFALVDDAGQATLWSHDGTSVNGSEPNSQLALTVDNGRVGVVLGEPGVSGIPELTNELVQRQDIVLKTWYTNGLEGRFRRLPDKRLRGKGFSYMSETARDAERLQGKRAEDFEAAGAVWRHEQTFQHALVGHVPGGRLYHSSTALGSGRELEVHFDVPQGETRIGLSLHAMSTVGPPAISELLMHTAQASDQTPGPVVTIVDVASGGWLAGIREVYGFCNTCIERKLPPETKVFIDGVLFDAWQTMRDSAPDEQGVGRVDNLLLMGLVRFERSLKVTSVHRGVAAATGTTTIWYYLADGRSGVPGALQVLVDDADVTSTLVQQASAAAGVSTTVDRLFAARFDHVERVPGPLRATAVPARRADRTWLTDGASVSVTTNNTSILLTMLGEIWLSAGQRLLALTSSSEAAVELDIDGQTRRVVAVTANGQGTAPLEVASDGWYPVTMIAAVADGEVGVTLMVDGKPPRVRTLPLLGGIGSTRWSAGPLRLDSLALPPGPHTLALRNRGTHDGQLEYSLLVE